MEFTKLILLIIAGLIKMTVGKVDLYSQVVLEGQKINKRSKAGVLQESVSIQMIEIYTDKVLTQKILSFDNVEYRNHGTNKNIVDGLVFDVSKSNNAGIAKNYFSDKGSKEGETEFILRFTNFNKCEVFSVPIQTLHTEVIQVGIVDNKGIVSYMTFNFGSTDKQDKKKLAEGIANACNQYVDSIKKKLDEFYKDVQNYWKAKAQSQQLSDQIKAKDLSIKTDKEALSLILIDKKNYEKNLDALETDLKKFKTEMDEQEKKLKTEYKILNDLKAKLADEDTNLTSLKSTISDNDLKSGELTKKVEKSNKESEDIRKRSDEIFQNIKKNKEGQNDQEHILTTEREKQNEINKEIDRTSKETNENGKKLAQMRKEIKQNNDLLEKLSLEDLPNAIKKTKSVVTEYEKSSINAVQEAKKTDDEIALSTVTIDKTKQDLEKIFNKSEIILAAKKGKINKNIKKALQVFRIIRKLFPVTPDIFMNNMWRFISMTKYEGMNYIQAFRPSRFNLYDNLYGLSDPERIKAKAIKAENPEKSSKSKKKFKLFKK